MFCLLKRNSNLLTTKSLTNNRDGATTIQHDRKYSDGTFPVICLIFFDNLVTP